MDESAPAPTILVVDDEAEIRDLLTNTLEALGYRVAAVSDGRSAIAEIQEHRPDLVLTDIYMPVADGFELLNWIQTNEARIPVVAMSGANSAQPNYDQLSIAQHLGAAAVLDKPFRHSQLVETIDRVLAKRGAPPRR